jgi:hypothetical protein
VRAPYLLRKSHGLAPFDRIHLRLSRFEAPMRAPKLFFMSSSAIYRVFAGDFRFPRCKSSGDMKCVL